MSKKILLTATELHLHQFWVPHIENFINNGYTVDIICSNVSNKIDILKEKLGDLPVSIDIVDLARSPFKPSNINGYKQMKKLLREREYDIIMTNEPVMGVVTRLVAKKYRKKGTKVLYTAHGFHFFTGAPKLNWMIFYPIEKWLAHYTDALVTINTEDYDRANRKFKAKNTYYLPGIGIDTSRFARNEESRKQKRAELGVKDDEIMLFSVAELTKRKNLAVAIKAMAKIKSTNVKYFVRGEGELKEYLLSLIKENHLEDKVFLLGYGKDIPQMCDAADVFIFPTLQEGLPVALMEAMANGLPVLCSDVRGNVDLIENGKGGYTYDKYDDEGFAKGIDLLANDAPLRAEMSANNLKKLDGFKLENIKKMYIEYLKQ